MSITPIDMSTLRNRIKEVKSLDTVKTLNSAKRTTQAARQLASIISPLDLKLASSLSKRVKDLEIDSTKTKAPNWFVQQLDRVPWLKKLRLFVANGLDKTLNFVKNIPGAIDGVLSKVPGWGFIKRMSGKAWELLNKFFNHPAVQKLIGAVGLIANVFSVFSSISQWNELFKMNDRFDKFTNRILLDLQRETTRTVNTILPIKRAVEKYNKEIPVLSDKVKDLNFIVPKINRQNAELAQQLKAQNRDIQGMKAGVAQAVTANVLNLAIGKMINSYQLGKLRDSVLPYSSQLPAIKTHALQIKDLQSKGAKLSPSELERVVREVGKNGKPGPQGKQGIPGIAGKNGTNGINGKNGVNGTNGKNGIDGKVGINGINGKNGIDGRNGVNGLTQVIYQTLPGKNGTNGTNGKDATMDPATKAQINAIFLETQGSKATNQAILTSAATTQVTVVQTQQQVGVIGNAINALTSLNQAIDKKLAGFIKWSGLDRVYTILILITNLMMIASLLRGTVDLIVQTIETGWSLFGFGLKDAEGNSLSLGTAIQGTLREGLESILGKETVNDLEVQWVKNNRIYQAASAIAWNVVSVVDQTRTLGEQTLGHLNKFANAAKDSGTVAEDAWIGHWSENPTAGPLGGALQNIESLSNKVAIAVMPVATAAGIKGELDQLAENKKNLVTAIETDDKKISGELKANKPKVPTTLTNMRLGEVNNNAS